MKTLLTLVITLITTACLAQDYIIKEAGDTIKNCTVGENRDGYLSYTISGVSQNIHIQKVICYMRGGELIAGGAKSKIKINYSKPQNTTISQNSISTTYKANPMREAAGWFIGGAITSGASIIAIAVANNMLIDGGTKNIDNAKTLNTVGVIGGVVSIGCYFVGGLKLMEASKIFSNGTAININANPISASVCFKF